MARIRFTIGDSDVWHEFQMDNYLLSRETFIDEHDLSYIIKREQDRCCSCRARKVEVLDDNGKMLAKSPDILKWSKLEYNNNDKE